MTMHEKQPGEVATGEQMPAFKIGQTVFENHGGTLPAEIVEIDSKGTIHFYRVKYKDPTRGNQETVSGWLFEYRLRPYC